MPASTPARGTPLGAGLQGDVPRVAAARRLVGTAGHPALDRLADLAARLVGAPAAQASLLGEVQTVGGAAGTVAATSGSRGPLADSLCTVTAELGTPLVVPDAVSDDRVRDLPPVRGGQVAAYLGVPLVARDGHVVGALCVMDAAPRAWSAGDTSVLEDLAAAAVTELELSALSVEYEAERVRWQLAVAAAGIGSFDWDLRSGRLDWDDGLLALFGLTREEFGGTIEAFDAAVHPDDLPRVGAALQSAIDGCSTYEAEYRVVRPDGRTVWVQARGTALAGEDGRAARVLGAAYDTTATRDTDARIARVLETMSAAFYLLDDAWRFRYVNAEAERLLGRARADLLDGVVWELFPATVGGVFETEFRAAVADGRPRSFEAYYPPPLDGWYEVRASPGADGLSVYFTEVTARHRAQAAAERAQRLAEGAQAVAERAQGAAEHAQGVAETSQRAAESASARLSMVATTSADLASTLDTEEAVGRLARVMVPALGEWCLVTLSDGARDLRDIASWHADPALRDVAARYGQLRLTALAPSSYLHHALRTGTLQVVQDATASILPLLTGEAADVLRTLAPSTAYVLPMRARGRTVGAVTLFQGAGSPLLQGDDLVAAVQLADRAGVAVDNARMYHEQRHLAETLQRSLLSAPVEPDHVHVVVRYQPAAREAQVGGDWYDAFRQPDGATVLVIGDVIGHDSQAAAAMSQVRTLLRGIAYTTGAGPAGTLVALDRALDGLKVGTLATAVVARLEQTPAEHEAGLTRLSWSNAGHLPPLVLHPDGSVTELHAPERRLLLGLVPGTERSDAVVTLERGCTVVLYTDGLVERRGATVQEGIDRLARVVAELAPAARERGTGASGIDLDHLVDGVLERMVRGRPEDDVALVVAHLHPEDRPRPPEAGPRTD